jgi:CubicO group peptidase (beta-lactamase class C family)
MAGWVGIRRGGRHARDHVSAPVGSYGWAGGLGTSWRSDPSEDMVVILLTQASWTSLVPGRVSRDFGILAYQAIDDWPSPQPGKEHAYASPHVNYIGR